MIDPYGVLPMLRAGEVDLALCNDPAVLEPADIDGVLLFEEPMLVALPAHHRLGHRARLRLAELAGDADAVVAAGDFASVHEGLEELIDVLAAIETPTVLIPGNNETLDALRSACAGWPAATVLHGDSADIDGVTYVDDSKATNLDALAKALESATQPVVLIAGGKDKGFGYEPLRELAARRVKRAVLIGEMAPAIEGAWVGRVPCLRAATLAEAVRLAALSASAGDVVLLSPGTSSFDMFKSYADRGDQFRQIVQELAHDATSP